MKYLPSIIRKARRLRRKQLSSYEIARILDIPNSTVRNWCSDLQINRHESLKLNNEFRRRAFKNQDEEIAPAFSKITSDMARFYAALLYGCEGAKYPSTRVVAFVNSDANLVKTFMYLMRIGFVLDEDKFRVQLQIHDTHSYPVLANYWSKLLRIPAGKFLKPTVTSPRGKMRRQNYQGTCSLRYNDFTIQLRLLGIFENFCRQGEVA